MYQRHRTSRYIHDYSFSSTDWRPLTSPPLTSLGSIPWKSVPFCFAQLTPPSFWNGTLGSQPWVSVEGGNWGLGKLLGGWWGGVVCMKSLRRCGFEVLNWWLRIESSWYFGRWGPAHFAVSFDGAVTRVGGQGSLPYHLPRPPLLCTHCLRTLNDTLFLLKSMLLCIRNDIVISAFVNEVEKSLGRARKGRGSPGREGRVCVWVGATADRGRSHTTQRWRPGSRRRGERGPADLSRVARAAEVSAENGHSLGRRREGGRLGHPKGRKSRRGNTGTHFTETGTQETGSIRTAHLQTAHAINTAQTQHTAQIFFSFFWITQDAEPQCECNP